MRHPRHWFSRPTCLEEARHQLREAEVAKLQADANVEWAVATSQMFLDRVARLQAYVKNAEKEEGERHGIL